ncbi:hypothetical protein JOF28_002232 [Leucobacter exalbidus]|uniref:Uncharacterized protein n=1 Tax=Leucobacter exalbidus TaxID=662960 RepID=A0A940T1M3_9MICO|nr:DUF5819 family protein [Leucobacter exalbidus]MBP1327000.1 hypothetical protein [Leucobacter exalbidus]
MAEPQLKRRPLVVRGALAAATLFVAWHIFASFLWIAPYSPLREVIPGNALTNYMIPMFGQSWSVFAPEPINGDYRIQVRAVVEEDGTERETEWVDATEVELSMIQYNLFPPRAGIGAVEVASQLKGSFDKLTADHKVIAGLNYFEDGWDDRLAEKMKSYGNPELVDAFVEKEQQTLAYATQVAYAMWGEDNVVRVQYHVTRQNVIPFGERHNPEAVRPGLQNVDTGWRGTVVLPGQSTKAFSDVFKKQHDKIMPNGDAS